MYLILFVLAFIPLGYYLYITYLTWGSRKDIEGSLTLVMGKAGSGKSTYMGTLVRSANKINRPIYCNYHVLGAIKLEHTDLGKFNLNGCDIIIDEAQLKYDSRDFKNFSEENKYFFSHFRHHKIRVYILSQSFEDLDVKIRRQAQDIYICQPFIKGILLMQKIKMRFGVSEDETDIVTLYKFNILGFRLKLGFLAWKYFDSYSKPYLPPLPQNVLWGSIPVNNNIIRKIIISLKEFKKQKIDFRKTIIKLNKKEK